MLKKSLSRGIYAFCIGMALGQIVQILCILVSGNSHLIPVVPAYRKYFTSDVMAIGVSNLLVGVISAAFGASSIIFDIERWSFLKQGILHFIITTIVWFPLAVFLWGLFIYPKAIINTFISFSGTYCITWLIQYRMCRRSIQNINHAIESRKE